MYAPHRSASSPYGRAPNAQMYSRVGVETGVQGASPHKLVSMLFDGYFDSLLRARVAMAAGKTDHKGLEIGRAVRIVEEGLKASLDLAAGGALAADLSDLYAYITLRLTQANLRNDEAALEECRLLMKPLHEAWQSIAPQVDGPSAPR
jgi:flagellar secretion chaperone FliS